MKHLYQICFLLLLQSHQLFAQASSYYWDGNEKIMIETDASFVLIEIPSNYAELDKLMSGEGIVAVSAKNNNVTQLILQSDSPSRLSATNIPGARLIEGFHQIDHKSISFITDEISIMFYNEADLNSIVKKHNLILVEKTPYGAYLFRTSDPGKALATANTIKETEKVIWSCPNFLNIIEKHTTDPLYNNQYYLNNTGQNGGTNNIDINAPEAWEITLGCPIRIAVIDDGVDNHEDMNGRVLAGFTAGGTTAGAPRNDCTKGHGVNCAGIIAASHNTMGVAGIAPRSQIIPVNIFPNAPTFFNGQLTGTGAATNAQIAAAINWAWRPDLGNAQIISNSWGGGAANPDITTQIDQARTNGRGNLGAIVVFASGNNSAGVSYPGNINGVITVGAINRNGNIQPYSNTGSEMDLVAPSGGLGVVVGTCIDPQGDVPTTDRMGANGYETGNYTNDFGGTSAACPQVAGVAALMLTVNPNLTESQVRTKLQQTATDMGSGGFDNTFGYGRLNAYAAVMSALPTSFISGPSTICPSASYSVTNQPSGTTVSWSSNNTSVLTINASTGAATRVGNGQVVITANISYVSGCAAFRVTKTVNVGKPIISFTVNGQPFQNGQVCVGSSNYIDVVGHDPMNSYVWSLQSGSNGSLSGSGPSASFSNYTIQCSGISLVASNSCGTTSTGLTICTKSCFMSAYKVYPNPAQDFLDVTFENTNALEALPEQIVLYSEKSSAPVKTVVVKEVYNQGAFKNGNTVEMQVKDLPRGTYYLHIIPQNDSDQKTDKIRILLE